MLKYLLKISSFRRQVHGITNDFIKELHNDFEIPFTDRASVENAVTVAAVCLAWEQTQILLPED